MYPKNCPNCEVSFKGKEIPEDQREFFGGKSHFNRVIGIEHPELYDGVLVWKCPDCGHEWNRFAPMAFSK